MDLGLSGRVAIVTGASRGIGAAVAAALTAESCRVVTVARSPTNGDLAVQADLTSPDAAASVVQAALDAFGRIDILVNNAGGNTARKLAAVTDDDWRAEFDLNFFAAVRLAQACVHHMRAAGWGRIISIASTYGREPDPYFGPYSAAKAALINYSKNLAQAYSAEGILSNCVIPGVTMTELVAGTAAAAAAATGTTVADVMAKVMAKNPVAAGRFGEPEEIAAAVTFLASDQAAWITGTCLTVDGGSIRAC